LQRNRALCSHVAPCQHGERGADAVRQVSALSFQLSAFSSQLSALSSQLSALSSQLSAFSSQFSVFCFPFGLRTPPYFCNHFNSSRTLIFPCQGFFPRPWPSPGNKSSWLGI